MKCVQTMIGTLAIVGLGFIAGVGHSLVRTMPVILGSSPSVGSATPESDPASDPASSPDSAAPLIVEPVEKEPAEIDPAPLDIDQPADSDYDARLDAPVPAGMLTLRSAHQMWIDGAYFVDSRLEHEYEQGHISGAAYLNAENFFSDSGQAEIDSIPPDAQVVIYCLGGDQCDASFNTKALLEQYGYSDLSIMGVGFDEWASAGLPTSSNQEGEESP